MDGLMTGNGPTFVLIAILALGMIWRRNKEGLMVAGGFLGYLANKGMLVQAFASDLDPASQGLFSMLVPVVIVMSLGTLAISRLFIAR